MLSQQSSWPQIIDSVSHAGTAGNPDPLRFPLFHEETLTQSWWNAGETMGRIKVIIAEGLAHGLVPAPFERTKNIVSFAFQHAPLHILEDSKVAWPNPGMWCQVSELYNLAARRDYEPTDADAHGHSLRGQGKDASTTLTHADTACEFTAQPPSRTPGIRSEFGDAFLPVMTSFPDPFVDDGKPGISRMSNGREGSEDQYMSDHTRSITPASKNQFDDLVASLSARKDISGGLLAPANTRVSSAANTPRNQSGASIEAEWRVFAHSHGISRSASLTMRDAPPKARQEPSDIGMESGISEPWLDMVMVEQPGLRVQMSPTKEVKGRKEGMSRNLEHPLPKPKRALADLFRRNGKENREGSAENPFVVSEGKRKRSNPGTNLMLPIHQGGSGSSPTRKAIRTEWEEELTGDSSGEL